MDPTIELDANTRVSAKMLKPDAWRVSINGAEVPSETQNVGFGKFSLSFALPDGRKVTGKLEPAGFMLWYLDLLIEGQLWADPGKQPFKCQACRAIVRPLDPTCASCTAPQPNGARRIYDRRCLNVSKNIRGIAVTFLAIAAFATVRSRASVSTATASLAATSAATNVTPEDGEVCTPEMIGTLVTAIVYSALSLTPLIATFYFATLARRSPVPASILSFGTWLACFAINDFARPELHGFVIAFQAIYLLVMFRVIQLAREARDLEPLAQPSPREAPRSSI
jgi:hypothetical protein